MKKKALMLLFTPFLLLGCSSNTVKFQDNYQTGEELKENEKTEVLSKALSNRSNVSSMSSELQTLNDVDYNMSKQTIKTKVSFYSNHYLMSEETSLIETSINGVNSVSKNKITIEKWVNDENQQLYTSTQNDSLGFSFSHESFSSEEQWKNVINYYFDIVSTFLSTVQTIYKEKGGSGYVAISSYVNEKHEPVNYGNTVKDRVTVNRSQRIIKINKNYQIISHTFISEGKTNMDPSTSSWYDKIKIINHQLLTINYNYTKLSSNEKRVNELNELIKQNYITSPQVELSFKNTSVPTYYSSLSSFRSTYTHYKFYCSINCYSKLPSDVNEVIINFTFYLTDPVKGTSTSCEVEIAQFETVGYHPIIYVTFDAEVGSGSPAPVTINNIYCEY